MRALILCLVMAMVPASGGADSLLRYVHGGPIRGPQGWQQWCLENLETCLPQGVSAITGPDALGVLVEAKRSVDARLARRSDPAGDDRWAEGVSFGDCEDFALAYRRELIRLGVSRAAMRLVVVKTERGERHAVLSVETGQGTQILDVRQAGPVSWHVLDYTWIGIEDSELPLWRLLDLS